MHGFQLVSFGFQSTVVGLCGLHGQNVLTAVDGAPDTGSVPAPPPPPCTEGHSVLVPLRLVLAA